MVPTPDLVPLLWRSSNNHKENNKIDLTELDWHNIMNRYEKEETVCANAPEQSDSNKKQE